MNDPQLALAVRAADASCHVARAVQQDIDSVRALTKDDRSPVTVADFAVQAIVAMALFEADPGALIVGEEHAEELRRPEQAPILEAVLEAVRRVRPDATADAVVDAIDRCDHDASAPRYWALDPVDGTKGFLRGQQYAIALGRIEDGHVTLGVMGCPNLSADPLRSTETADPTGVIYAAARGQGAWETDASGTPTRRLAAAAWQPGGAVRTCESVEKGHSKQSDTARILETLGEAGTPVRLDSQCKYAVVARGQADAYLRLPTRAGYVERIWDHAAGSLIATEAGAVVSDVRGQALDFSRGARLESNRGVVCAAEALHGRLVEIIRQLGIGAPAAHPPA